MPIIECTTRSSLSHYFSIQFTTISACVPIVIARADFCHFRRLSHVLRPLYAQNPSYSYAEIGPIPCPLGTPMKHASFSYKSNLDKLRLLERVRRAAPRTSVRDPSRLQVLSQRVACTDIPKRATDGKQGAAPTPDVSPAWILQSSLRLRAAYIAFVGFWQRLKIVRLYKSKCTGKRERGREGPVVEECRFT